jgi:hypothetical protein
MMKDAAPSAAAGCTIEGARKPKRKSWIYRPAGLALSNCGNGAHRRSLCGALTRGRATCNGLNMPQRLHWSRSLGAARIEMCTSQSTDSDGSLTSTPPSQKQRLACEHSTRARVRQWTSIDERCFL